MYHLQHSSTPFAVSYYLRYGMKDLHHSPRELANHGPYELGRQKLINNLTLDRRLIETMVNLSAHTQIAKILEMAKETHWLENKHLPTDEIQRQWADKSAPLAAVLGVGAPTHPINLNSATETFAPLQTTQSPSPPPVSTASSRRCSTVCFRSINPRAQADF